MALVQPKVILALGRFASQSLLCECVPAVTGVPLGRFRGHIYHYQGHSRGGELPPAYLLRSQGDEAHAWADLSLALSLLKPVAT